MNNWDHLRHFAAVAEHGSVAAAARSAGISHATVLRALGRLEAELGVRLFDHLRSGYRLTPEGSELLPHAQGMAREAEALARKAKGQGEAPAGELGIAIPDPSIVDLMPMIAAFRAMYPNVEANLRRGPVATPNDLLDRDIRVVFMLTNAPPEDLVGRKLGSIRFRFYRTEDAEDCWIDWTGSHGGLLDSEAAKGIRLTIDTHHTMIVGSHGEALSAVRASVGVSLLAVSAIDDSESIRSMGQRDAEIGLWMLTHPEFRNDGRVRALMAYGSTRFSQESH